MDQILTALAINETLLTQFVVSVFAYFLIKSVLLSKVGAIVTERNAKTDGLSANAEKEFEVATSMAAEYEEKINSAHKESNLAFKVKSEEIMKEDEEVIQQAQKEATEFIDSKRTEYLEEIDVKRKDILSNANELSGDLVRRLTQ